MTSLMGMTQLICVIIGSALLGIEFGAIVGFGVGLISWAIMPSVSE